MRSRGNWRLFYNEISMVYAFAVLFCPARHFGTKLGFLFAPRPPQPAQLVAC